MILPPFFPSLLSLSSSLSFPCSQKMPEDVLDQVEAGKAILVDVRLQPDYEEVRYNRKQNKQTNIR